MFKLNNNLLPEICIDMFTKNSNIHNYSTRTRNCFHIPKIKTNLCKNSIRFQGAIVGNLFMKNINSNCTIPTYKYRVKNFLRNTILIGLWWLIFKKHKIHVLSKMFPGITSDYYQIFFDKHAAMTMSSIKYVLQLIYSYSVYSQFQYIFVFFVHLIYCFIFVLYSVHHAFFL